MYSSQINNCFVFTAVRVLILMWFETCVVRNLHLKSFWTMFVDADFGEACNEYSYECLANVGGGAPW